MVGLKQGLPSWIGAVATRVDFEGKFSSLSSSSSNPTDNHSGSSAAPPRSHSDVEFSIGDRAFSAAGAAFVSAVIVNPLDVAKTRLQAQAAGVSYQSICRMGCETDMEGFTRLWRGSNTSLALTVTSYVSTVSGGVAWEHNLLRMFHFLQFAGQPLSTTEGC